MKEEKSFVKLLNVMDTMIGENGCAWDRAQTHQSMRSHLLEESYEVADAIDQNNMYALCEELGDLLLQVIMHSRLAEKDGHFNLSDVIHQIAEKLVRRHSHIFGSDIATSPTDVEKTWEANKNKEKAIFTPLENMKAVPKALPALARAQKVIKRSEKDFPNCIDEIKALLDCMQESKEEQHKQENCGRILLLIAALSTKLQLNAEFCLTNAVQAFITKPEHYA